MAVIHRALFTWILFACFAILLALKLDARSQWNWFIVLCPMWTFDICLLLTTMFELIQQSHRRHISGSLFKRFNSHFYCLICILSKLCFQLLLCVRLQYWSQLSIYIVMIPLWSLLITCCVYFASHFS